MFPKEYTFDVMFTYSAMKEIKVKADTAEDALEQALKQCDKVSHEMKDLKRSQGLLSVSHRGTNGSYLQIEDTIQQLMSSRINGTTRPNA